MVILFLLSLFILDSTVGKGSMQYCYFLCVSLKNDYFLPADGIGDSDKYISAGVSL